MLNNKTKFLALILVSSFLLTGCSPFSFKIRKPNVKIDEQKNNQDNTGQAGQSSGAIKEKLAAQTKIKKFENIDELKAFMETAAVGSGYGFGGGRRTFTNEAFNDSLAMPTAGLMEGNAGVARDKQASQTSSDYSKTNIQVEGVDEADIIKTDGKYVYAVANNNLFVIQAAPAEKAEILAKIEFKSRPEDIYINGDSLIVFGQDQEIYNTEMYRIMPRRSSYSFFKVFDIKDRKNPKQIRDLGFEGSYFNSRMIGDYVYFATNYYSYNFIDEMPVPLILENGNAINKCVKDKCAMPPVYYFDIPYDNYNFTTVAAINIKDTNEKVASESYLLSGNQNMYVSQSNIYITYTKYLNEDDLAMEVVKEIVYPKLSASNQEKITKIEQTENYILSPQEKLAKIGVIMEKYGESLSENERNNLEKEVKDKMKQKYQDISKELEKTVIHKIAINKGKLEYKTFGEVTGQVLNQFSMDEDNGFFRIATTKNETWSQFADESQKKSYSNLYVLDDNLKIVGSLENLAEGERIYSARFMQGRVYLVTFERTDPLFVIDLKDPKNPKVLGKLKIPGFSNYLHPYDETTLIGIGKETEENQREGVITRGIKISLFDVSEVENPKEAAKYEIGDRGSDSIALNDHKAFLFSKDKNLLVIPVSLYESAGDKNSYGKFAFSGAAVFEINKNSINLKGKIDHSDGGKIGAREFWGGYDYYDNTVKRSLYINDVLYTLSSKYLKMNKLSDLELIKNLELKKEKTGSGSDFEIVN